MIEDRRRMSRQVEVSSITTHGSSTDGVYAVVEFVDGSGETIHLGVPKELQGSFLMSFQAACVQAGRVQKATPDSTVMTALNVSGARLSVGPTGKVSLVLTLVSGLALAMPIARSSLKELLVATQNALQHIDQGGSSQSH